MPKAAAGIGGGVAASDKASAKLSGGENLVAAEKRRRSKIGNG